MGRGDVYHVALDPVLGREQAGSRYVLIITTADFNRLGTPLVVPITQGGNLARSAGFAVTLMGSGGAVQGVVLCNQLRTLDLKARGGRFVETVPAFIIDDVLAKVGTLVE